MQFRHNKKQTRYEHLESISLLQSNTERNVSTSSRTFPFFSFAEERTEGASCSKLDRKQSMMLPPNPKIVSNSDTIWKIKSTGLF